ESESKKWWPWALGLLSAIGFFFHPLFPVIIGVPLVAYLTTNWRIQKWSKVLSTGCTCAVISVLVNLVWLYPTYRDFHGYSVDLKTQELVSVGLLGQELLGEFHGNAHGSKLYPLLLLASLWTVVSARRKAEGRLWLGLFCTGIAFELLAYLGGTF